MTLRSFSLIASHDTSGRDAHQRGFDQFQLFAWNASTSQFDLIFQYDPSNPYGNSSPPPNGFLSTNCIASYYLCLAANLVPVTTDRFRATFRQLGSPSNASGPRINELDGYDTSFADASIPSTVPLPATLPLLASGIGGLGLIGWRRKRKNEHRAAA